MCTSPAGARDSTREACYKCGGRGHIKAKCPSMMPELCYSCGREGHYASECKEERASGGDPRDRRKDRDPRDYERRGADFPPGGFGKKEMHTGCGVVVGG